MEEEELARILKHSYSLVLKTKLKYSKYKNEFNIDSRTKIKNLGMALRQFDNPKASFLHFIKYATYSLPRSRLHIGDTDFLTQLLKAIQDIENNAQPNSDYKHEIEQLHYLTGYASWTMDSLVIIFSSISETEINDAVKRMLETEFAIINEPFPTDINDKIIKWYNKAKSGTRKDYQRRR